MFLYVNIGIAILLVVYLCRGKCKETRNEFSMLFGGYNPERQCMSKKELRNNLLIKSLAFLENKKVYMTHRMFKTLEFYIAENIIALSIAISNSDDSYNRVKYIVKINNLIDEYKNIYYNNDDVINSLVYRIYQNMLRIETDIYELYKIMNEILKTTVRRQINTGLFTLYKNFFWHSTLRYRYNTLLNFAKSNIK
jgi:hypothetical protein